MSDGVLILLAGALLAFGIGASLVAGRLRVPGLVLFLGLGMVLGSDVAGLVSFGDSMDDVELARTIGIVALALILFEGGLAAGWDEIRPVFGRSVALATVGTLVTAAIVGLAAAWLLDLDLEEGLLLGSIVAATDGAAVFSVLRGSSIDRRLARMLEGESGFNDAVAIVLVLGLIEVIEDPGFGALDVALLSLYLTGLALGSGHIPARRTVADFHDGLAWVSQIAVFFTFGLLVFPSEMGKILAEGLLIAAVLMFVARPLATLVSTVAGGFPLGERGVLRWAGPGGGIPILLAPFP